MDAYYSIGSVVLSIISYLVSVFTAGGLSLLINIYNLYISRYLLSPNQAYPSIVSGTIGKGVQSLYYFSLFQIYDPIFSIVLIILGITILLNSSLSLGYNFKHIWIKIFLILLLSNISFFLSQDLLYLGYLIYLELWDYGIPNHNFSQGINILSGVQLGGTAGSEVSFLILIIFIFLILFLVLFLSMRLAIIYTFPILLPILSILYLIPQTKELARRGWDIFIDSIFAPILMAFPLILATYVVNNSVLTLGFLALTDSIPIMLSKSSASRISTLFLGQAVSTGTQRSIGIAVGLTGPMRNIVSFFKNAEMAKGPSNNSRNNSTGSSRQYSSRNTANYSQSQFFRGKP